MRTDTDASSRTNAEQRQAQEHRHRQDASNALPTDDARIFRRVYHSEFTTPPDEQPDNPEPPGANGTTEPDENDRRPGHERLGIAFVMGLVICAAVLALAAFFAPSGLAWSIALGILLAALILWWFKGLDEVVFPQRNRTRDHSHRRSQ